jgi:hypothetical protein
MSIALLSHPFGAGQVTIESMSCTIRFTIRVNVQHDPGNLLPVGSGRVGVEQTKIRDYVLLIIHRQRRVGRRRIVDIWIERRFLHWHPTQQRMGLATACTLAAIARSRTGYISNDSTVMMRCLACITGRTDEHHKAVLDRFIDHPESSP